MPLPSQDDIRAAAARIAPHVRRTPVVTLADGDLMPDRPVTLKLEHLQHTACFKARGAFNGMLSTEMPAAGAIAASGGNHGAAVAYAARALGHPAEIFVPTIIAPAKKARLESYGATVNVVGQEFAEALDACMARQAETGAALFHAFDQSEILAGQGTVGLEFEEQAPDLDTVLIAVGGGGLIGGIASWYRGRTKLVAVEAEGTATLHAARAAGDPVDISVSGITADALGALRVGNLPFEAASQFVADSVLVSDDAIRETQRRLWDDLRLITEPGGAVALAALLSGAYVPAADEKVGVLVCGGNAAPSSFLGDAA